MLEINPALSEFHFLHNFISGLFEEIRHGVMMFKPRTLEEAYELAKNKEKKVEALRRRSSFTKGLGYSSKPVQ